MTGINTGMLILEHLFRTWHCWNSKPARFAEYVLEVFLRKGLKCVFGEIQFFNCNGWQLSVIFIIL